MTRTILGYLAGTLAMAGLAIVMTLTSVQSSSAITALPEPDSKPGGYGLEATKTQAPPTTGATITTPGNGSSFSTSPITVTGICPTGLLVQIYNNNVMVGAIMCDSGSFSTQMSLFAGTNELKAIVYDDLYQAGPESNIVTVNYTDTNFTRFGELITLTSNYGRRSAANNTQLDWPLQLSGGTGPYAFSIDWGDGSELQLLSQSLSGVVDIAHTYKKAGIYQVNIKAADTNGVSAFLQVIAVSSGEVGVSETEPEADKVSSAKPVILWVPTLALSILLLPTYWLGRRSQLVTIRRKMLKERDRYQDKR